MDAHVQMTLLVNAQINSSTQGTIATLLHDLGKPATRKENHEKKRVSMINHEAVSAFMALEVMEKLSKETTLTLKDKVDIFFAICYHIDFHKIIAQCYKEDNFNAFIARYKGQASMAKILVELGISDSLGRFSDPEISPKEETLWTLNERMTDAGVFDQMGREKVTNSGNPVIEILIGLPCSGKSTYRAKKQGYTHISRDDILLELGNGKGYDDAFKSVNEGTVNQMLDTQLKKAIKNQENIIFDLTNLVKSRRMGTLSQAKGYYRKGVLFLEELPVIQQRNEARQKREGKFIPAHVFHNMMTSFSVPSFEEFDEIVVIYKGEYITL